MSRKKIFSHDSSRPVLLSSYVLQFGMEVILKLWKTTQYKDIIFIILDSKQICLLPQRETLFLSSRVVCLTKTLEKIVQDKEQLGFA